MLLEFSAITEAEKVIQEMQERIRLCKEVEDKTVAHIEVSRDLNESLREKGLQPEGWSGLRNAMTEIWGLQSTPVDVKGLALKLEHTQHELASLDQEYEQLRYEKQEVESKLSMTIESNKELLLEKQELANKIKELEELTDNLDNSQPEGLVHEDNLEIVRAGHLLTQEVNELKSQLEKLTAENDFYSQENKELKKQKLEWVVNKDENEKVAQLESKIAELESENQSLESQKNKAVAMVEEKAEQAIPQASDWKVHDIVQVIGTGEVVKICGYPLDKKLGHFVCRMPDGETRKNFFTGQLRFVQSGTDDIQTPQADSQLTLDIEPESHAVEPGALVEINSTEKGQDKTWNGLPAYVQEIKGEKARIALQGDYREKWFALRSLKVLEPAPVESGNVEVVEPVVPAQERANHFKTGFNKKTTWEDFQLFALKDSEVLTEISGFSNKTGKKVKEALPLLFADYILRTSDRSDFEWINSQTFEKLVEQAISELEPEKKLQQAAVEFFATHNSPKKLQKVRWEKVRQYAQGNSERIDALIKCASANGKENSKTRFCDCLENLLVDYIRRTSDRTDLQWVPFANLVLTKLGEAISPEENTSAQTALSSVNPASMIQGGKKISDCKTVEQLENLSACNPSNIQDADDAGVIVDIYEIHIERTGEFEKLNWLPESIQDEIYQSLGRGTRPLDFELGEKVRGVDLYSAYCSKAGVVTRLTPGLISVAWEDGKFNTHYAEELEIIPESLALQVA